MARIIAIVLLLPGLAVAQQLAADAKVLKVVGAASVRLCIECRPQRMTFPMAVIPAAGKIVLKPGEQPRVVSATTGGTRLPELERTLKPSWEPAGAVPKNLVITIDPPLRNPGTYEIAVDLLPVTRPSAPAETLRIVVGGATLEGPDKLLIHRTHGLVLADESHGTPLVLFETGQLSGIEKLDLHPMTFVHNNEPLDTPPFNLFPRQPRVSGNVSAGTVALEIAAGEQHIVEYQVSDALPRGLTSGSVRVMAPELTKALVIPVEIRSLLSREFLALVIVAGLILSYFVKVVLHNRLQRSRARAAAATLLQEVELDCAKFPDSKFRDDTSGPLNALITAYASSDAATIEAKRKALDTGWREARQDVEKRRADFRTMLDGWQKIVSLPWELPRAIEPALTAARDASGPSAALDQKGDVKGATTLLEEARIAAARNLSANGSRWRSESRAFFDLLVSANAGISASTAASLKSASDAWRGTFELGEPTADPAQVQPLLRAISGEYGTARKHLRELSRVVRREFDQLSVILMANNADAIKLDEVKRALGALDRIFESAIEHPDTAAASVVALLDTLQQAWADVFATAGSADPDEVQKKVRHGDFRGAADLLGGGTILSITDAATAAAGGGLAIGFLSPPIAGAASVVFGPGSDTSPYLSLLLESQREIAVTQLIRTLVVGGMFFIWAFSTSSGAFDGTTRGLLAAFFSAFSLDVGVDALLGRIKGSVFG